MYFIRPPFNRNQGYKNKDSDDGNIIEHLLQKIVFVFLIL